MKKVIFIGGQLACGKTTLARNLSSELNIDYFYKDIFKERLCDVIGFANREENLRLSRGAFYMFCHIAEQYINNGESLILESNFRQEELDRLYKMFSDANYKVISIVLYGEEDVLYQRYINRFKNENRHRAHANFETKEEFDYLLN